MKTREYIESGKLELYALGALSAAEQQEVEQMAEQHPEVKAALRDAQQSLENVADAVAVKPPEELRNTILAKATAKDPASSTTVKEMPVQKNVDKKGPSALNWLAIAATILLVLSLGINTVQYQNIQKLQEQLGTTLIRLANLQTQSEVMVTNYENLQENLAVLRDTSTAVFPMKSVEGRDASFRADVLWNAETETVYLDVKNLPAVASDKQYQLWALKDGQPIDMGVFDAIGNTNPLLEMGKVPGADAFAVTLEPRGGSENPTMEEMYVYGTPAAG